MIVTAAQRNLIVSRIRSVMAVRLICELEDISSYPYAKWLDSDGRSVPDYEDDSLWLCREIEERLPAGDIQLAAMDHLLFRAEKQKQVGFRACNRIREELRRVMREAGTPIAIPQTLWDKIIKRKRYY